MNENEELITKVLQNKVLEVLKDLAKILTENDIQFFLACGTALGCVRHEGFIPWDDDIDVYIKGEDYPKLKEVFSHGDIGNLQLHDFESKKGYPYIFPKIVAKDTVLKEKELWKLDYVGGVYIDVFPLHRLSDNVLVQYVQEMKRYARYSMLRLYYYEQRSSIRKVLSYIARLFVNPDKIQKKMYKELIKPAEGEYVIEPLRFKKIYKFRKELFEDSIIGKFEGVEMPIPQGFREYLEIYYDDYMQLPPIEKRKSNHAFSELIIEDKKYV